MAIVYLPISYLWKKVKKVLLLWMYNSESLHLRANSHTTPTVHLDSERGGTECCSPSIIQSNICWNSQVDTETSLLEDWQSKSCGGVEVSFFPLCLFSSVHPLLFLSGHFLHPPTSLTPCTFSPSLLPSLSPLCLFICLLVTLSLHPLFSSLPPSPQSSSVTGEFPELITGGYPRVQRGPAHLQAKGAREGCLITFSTAWLKTAHKSLVHRGLCARTRMYTHTHTQSQIEPSATWL